MTTKTKKKKAEWKLKKPISKPKVSKKNENWVQWIIALAALTIFIIGATIRYYAFGMPVVGDEAVYGILGKKAMMGEVLYRDIYEMKPPLLFYLYGLSTTLFSWGTVGMRITGLVLVLLNSFLVFSIARKFSKIAFSALIGATAFFFLNNLFAFATETASEHFFMTFILSGFYLLIRPISKNHYLNIFLSGFLIAGAAMIKQTAAIYGLGALVLLIIFSLRGIFSYQKKELLKSVAFLAAGAFFMILLNLLPILFTGTLTEAKHWLVDLPTQYTSSIAFSDSLQYLDYLGMRIFKYQMATIILCLIGIPALLFAYKKAYLSIIAVLLGISIFIIFPGFRYYSQYWIPLMTLLALLLLPIKGTLERLKVKPGISALTISLATLTCIVTDTILHQDQYFEEGYIVNAEKAYNVSNPYVYREMVNYIKREKSPTQDFMMLGSSPFAYYMMDHFPTINHIYPRIISRTNDVNLALQQKAIEQMKAISPDYVLFAVTGKDWRTPAESIDNWYQQAFAFMQSEYEPLVSYQYDSRKYIIQAEQAIDTYIPNQLIIFKKRT